MVSVVPTGYAMGLMMMASIVPTLAVTRSSAGLDQPNPTSDLHNPEAARPNTALLASLTGSHAEQAQPCGDAMLPSPAYTTYGLEVTFKEMPGAAPPLTNSTTAGATPTEVAQMQAGLTQAGTRPRQAHDPTRSKMPAPAGPPPPPPPSGSATTASQVPGPVKRRPESTTPSATYGTVLWNGQNPLALNVISICVERLSYI